MADINYTYRKLNQNIVGLFAFNLVAQQGNFTGAADILGVSQSAISQKIKALELELGVTLFKRENRGVTLTSEGIRLLNVVHPAMTRMGNSVASLIERKLKPRVHVSTDFAFSTFWLLPRLSQLRLELGDEIELQIRASQTPLEDDGDDCDINIHVKSCDAMNTGDVLLLQEKVVAVCSPQFLKTNGPISTASELLDKPLLSLTRPPSAQWQNWQSWFEELGITGERTSIYNSFNNYDMVIQAARAGHGMALGWLGLIDDLIQDGSLVQATKDVVTSRAGYVMGRNHSGFSWGPDCVFQWIMDQMKNPSI